MHNISRPPAKQEKMLVSDASVYWALFLCNTQLNTEKFHFFFCNTDEVFQKVADDFSSCALEFLQGEILLQSSIWKKTVILHFIPGSVCFRYKAFQALLTNVELSQLLVA